MAGGFLNRWSRRKSGEQIEPEKKQVDSTPQLVVKESADLNVSKTEQETPPPATLDDVEKIDRFAPDFSAFMKPGVDPTVQQAAMKKMFSDPHFNVMDGLDIYIDDYSKPDPIPLEMLKRMVQSDMLNIFRKGNGSADDGEKQFVANSVDLEESSQMELPDQGLAMKGQADLRSTHLNTDLGELSSDDIPSDQKNS